MMLTCIDAFPYGVCDACGYEFNSEEYSEYKYHFCPKCGTDLKREANPDNDDTAEEEAVRDANMEIIAQVKQNDPTVGEPEGSPGGSRCDRCGRPMVNFVLVGEQRNACEGGNCTICGDDLCVDCAKSWTEDGECAKCVDDALLFYAKAKQETNLSDCTWEAARDWVRSTSKSFHEAMARAKLPGHDFALQSMGMCENIKTCSKAELQFCANNRCDDFVAALVKRGKASEASGKIQWSLLPYKQLAEVVKIFMQSVNSGKYERDDWQKAVRDDAKLYEDALMRHSAAYFEGEQYDENDLYHLAAVCANALILLWYEMNGKTPGYRE